LALASISRPTWFKCNFCMETFAEIDGTVFQYQKPPNWSIQRLTNLDDLKWNDIQSEILKAKRTTLQLYQKSKPTARLKGCTEKQQRQVKKTGACVFDELLASLEIYKSAFPQSKQRQLKIKWVNLGAHKQPNAASSQLSQSDRVNKNGLSSSEREDEICNLHLQHRARKSQHAART
jgi:hypothetical protein